MTETQTASFDSATDCGDCQDNTRIESAARELYQTAALFVGDESEALQLVEQTVTSVEMDPCADADGAKGVASRDLVQRALARLTALRPGEMHPVAIPELGGCVDTSDSTAAEVARQQLDVLLSGRDRSSLRAWLEGLRPVERTVFVLRAVLGRSGAESADLLRQATGDSWTESHVGGAYRAALCSLASSLVHAAAH